MTPDHRPDAAASPDLAELFRAHANGLAGAVRGILGRQADTQEILQEAFLKAWRHRAAGAEPRDVVAWLFIITMNLAKDARRRKARRAAHHPIEEVDPMQLQGKDPEPAAGAERAETLAAARAAIHTLSEPEKEVFLLRTSAGLSFDQAAAALGIPVGTAKTRMRAALGHLRSRLRGFAATEWIPATDPRHSAPTRDDRRAR
ncbi:MAG: RNA polymerase sigma factor [Planctomycetes bacterium]|nr:RNA polymerase sigma factor [Planctomycetota bacterium]MCB9870545.1 RNA polymerase sigma factor [Planctomycetota bacterium]MCB9889713.1 RNA polymerase sigma factor [Planctomycetota bacterium]